MINYLLSKFKRARQNSAEAKAQSAFYSALVKFIEDSGERVSMSDIYAREEFKRIPRAQSVRMSKYLYDTNEFAQGMIERYVKKIVGTGFLCSPTPCGDLINCTPQELEVFATYAESAFLAYCNTPESVSWRANRTLGEIQRTILRESLIYGDVLVLITYGSDGFPKTEIIRGDRIQTPHYYIDNPLIKEGVLINPDTQKPEKFFVKGDINNLSGNSEPVFYEIEAYTKTGRRQAILFKSNDDHSEGIRGDPFLSINMRTLSEINTSLAAEQRAMLINSLLVMTQTRGPDETEAQANTVQDALLEGLSNLSAIGKKVISNEPKPPTRRTDANAYDISEPRKGLLITGMPHGSDIKSHNSSRPNLNVANFIAECVKTACRAKSMPPEVYLMEYNSSFGASQAAKADFFEIQRLEASRIVADVCTPLYREFLLSLVSASRVSMPGYIEAIQTQDFIVSSGWERAIWNCAQFRQNDLRTVKCLSEAADRGWLSNSQISEMYFGTNFMANLRQIEKETAAAKARGLNLCGNSEISEELIYAGEDDGERATKKKSQIGDSYYQTDTFDGVKT